MACLTSRTQVFAVTLAECQAVVSGSAALHLMLSVKTTHWAPQDFDIFVPSDRYQCLCVKLENQRYFLVGSTTEDLVPHSFCHIQQAVTFGTNFSITLYRLMNFVFADHIFCAYPELTLRRLSIINPGLVYCGEFNIAVVDALRKYDERGFRHIRLGTFGVDNSKSRTLTGNKCLWVGWKVVPRLHNSGSGVLRSY